MLTYNKMFRFLESKGVDQVDVIFSGGNDSGSVEKFVVHVYGEEKEMEENEINKIHPDLSDLLSSVVYNDYGSFAGDYDVSGKYVFSVKDKTVKKECSESYTEYKEIDEIVMNSDYFDKEEENNKPIIPDCWERTSVTEKMKDKNHSYGKKLIVCKTCNKPRTLDSFSDKIYCSNDCDKVYPASNFDYLGNLNYDFDDNWNEIKTADDLKKGIQKKEK